MKILLFIFTFALFSCGQTDTKQKELELKERELALKEKEFALKQKDSNVITSKPVSNNKESNSSATTVYNYAEHSNFQAFWKDFKAAINANDKEAVLKMTEIPFKDPSEDAYNKTTTRTSKTAEIFLKKYDQIFTASVIKAINSNKYSGWTEPEPPNYEETIKKGEYILNVPNEYSISHRETCNLVFAKKNGIFKLSHIPYYS